MFFDGDWDAVTAAGLQSLVTYLEASGITPGESFAQDFVKTRRAGRERSVVGGVEYTATQALQDTLVRHGYADPPVAVIERGLELFFGPEEEHWVAYPDTLPSLEALRARGLRIGAISNATDDALIKRMTIRAGIAAFLNPLITSAAMGWRKPDPRIFDHVLEYWKVGPGQVVMVGDWQSMDILGAHRVGMKAVLVDQRWPTPPAPHARFPDPELLDPDETILQLAELPGVLERLNEKQAARR